MMVVDELVICRHCGSDACYQYHDATHIKWQCMDCGFYTNTYMLKNSELVLHLKDTSPDLFNDISYEDADGLVWYPLIVNKPGIGIISPIGTSSENWSWAFIPEVPILVTERHKYPVKDKPGEYHSFKSDMGAMQQFAPGDFILTLQAANLLNCVL